MKWARKWQKCNYPGRIISLGTRIRQVVNSRTSGKLLFPGRPGSLYLPDVHGRKWEIFQRGHGDLIFSRLADVTKNSFKILTFSLV